MLRFVAGHRRTIGHWAAELAIVVAGVLIALYAQQWDSDRQQRRNATEAKERIRHETAWNSLLQMEQLALDRCQRQRLKAIAERLAAGEDRWKDLVYTEPSGGWAVPRIYRPIARNYQRDAYESAVASGAIGRLAPDERRWIADQYQQYSLVEDEQKEERRLIGQIDALASAGPIEAPERLRLLAVVASLERFNDTKSMRARQALSRLPRAGLVANADQRRWLKQTIDGAQDGGITNYGIEWLRQFYGACVDPAGFRYEKWVTGA